MVVSQLFSELMRDFSRFDFDSDFRKKTEDGKLVIEVDVPGFNKDTLDVECTQGFIKIAGENGDRKLVKNFYIGNKVPENVNTKDGVLKFVFDMEKIIEDKKIPIEQG